MTLIYKDNLQQRKTAFIDGTKMEKTSIIVCGSLGIARLHFSDILKAAEVICELRFIGVSDATDRITSIERL